MRSPSTGIASSSAQAGVVNSSANTVASGSSSRLIAHRYCPPRCTVLRKMCSGICRLKIVARRSARAAARASMTIRPRPARTARISMTLSVPARKRIDTAIAENDSSAPVIHRTTRTIFPWVTRDCSLRVRLIFRPRLVEGGKLVAGRVGRDDLGETIERHLQAPRIVDLRHQADICERDVLAEGVGPRPDQDLERFEPFEDPMVVPGVDLGLVLAELVLEVA